MFAGRNGAVTTDTLAPGTSDGAWPVSAALGAGLSALVLVFAYAYAQFGGPWVDALDDRSGDIVAQRAASAGAAGQTDRAVALFDTALRLGFGSPDQNVWIRQKYVMVLLDAGRFERAEAVAEEILSSGVPEIGDWVSRQAFERIHAAASVKGEHESAVRMAQAWSDAASRCGNAAARGQGLFLKAVSLRTLGRNDEARSALAAVLDTTPTPEMKAAVESELDLLGRG